MANHSILTILLLLLAFGHSVYSQEDSRLGITCCGHNDEEKKDILFSINTKYNDKYGLVYLTESKNKQNWDTRGLWSSPLGDDSIGSEHVYETVVETNSKTDTITEILYETRQEIGSRTDSDAIVNQICFEIPSILTWTGTSCGCKFETEKIKAIEWQCSVSASKEAVKFSITEEKEDSSFAVVVADTMDNYTYRDAEIIGKKYFVNLRFNEKNTNDTISVKISIKKEISSFSSNTKKIQVGERPVKIHKSPFSDTYHSLPQHVFPTTMQAADVSNNVRY